VKKDFFEKKEKYTVIYVKLLITMGSLEFLQSQLNQIGQNRVRFAAVFCPKFIFGGT
jgi:hypothetical protein